MAVLTTNVLAVELTLASKWILDPSRSTLALGFRELLWRRTGRFAEIEGSVERGHAFDLHVSFAAGTKSLTTGVRLRDQQLRSYRFFDAVRYPALTFESTSFGPIGAGGARLEGRLTIKGQTRTSALEAALEPWDDGLRLRATGTVDRQQFRMIASPALEMGGLLLGSTLTLSLDALLRRWPNPRPPRPAWRDIL